MSNKNSLHWSDLQKKTFLGNKYCAQLQILVLLLLLYYNFLFSFVLWNVLSIDISRH